MDFKPYNSPIQLLTNEQVSEIVKGAILEEMERKKEKNKSRKRLIKPEKFFKSKLFNKKW